MTTYSYRGLFFDFSRADGSIGSFSSARIVVAAEDSLSGFNIETGLGETHFKTGSMDLHTYRATAPDPLGHFDWVPVDGPDGIQSSAAFYRVQHISWGKSHEAVVLTMELMGSGSGQVAMWRLSGDLLPSIKDAAGLEAFKDVVNVPVTSADLDLSQTIAFSAFSSYKFVGENDLVSPIGSDLVYSARKFAGGLGDDTISGGFGDDTFRGDAGNDVLSGSYGNNLLFGGTGNDSINGGAGERWGGTVSYGSDTLHGGGGADTLRGGGGADLVYGGAGRDLIIGDKASSVIEDLFGNRGGDSLYGGGGNDTVQGGGYGTGATSSDGRDALFGGDGNDLLEGGTDSDTLTGGAGSDVFYFRGATGVDAITDFDLAHDALDLGYTKAQVHASVNANGLVLTWADGTILLEGLVKADFSSLHVL